MLRVSNFESLFQSQQNETKKNMNDLSNVSSGSEVFAKTPWKNKTVSEGQKI